MKICIAQTKSHKGDIQKNILNHLKMIKWAIEYNSDLIVFPELSITGYEPKLAKEFAKNIDDQIFNPFQKLSNENNITIGIGVPTLSAKGIKISMLLFKPNLKRIIYSKQILHKDESPYFVCGHQQIFLEIKKEKIAFGICYETLQRNHFEKAIENKANIYIASVAKSGSSLKKAYSYFPNISAEFNTPILMANSVGKCDNFMSVGQSSIWNKQGTLVNKLDYKNQGILIYDTLIQETENYSIHISKCKLSDLNKLFNIYQKAKEDLEKKEIKQWTNNYPTKSILERDINNGFLYILKKGKEIIGAINISQVQEKEYQSIQWKFNPTKILVIHRLVIHPNHQRNGYAEILMNFAEEYAIKNYYTTIRLDVYSQNKVAKTFYENRKYIIRGDVYFPERQHPFHAMEKEIKL